MLDEQVWVDDFKRTMEKVELMHLGQAAKGETIYLDVVRLA